MTAGHAQSDGVHTAKARSVANDPNQHAAASRLVCASATCNARAFTCRTSVASRTLEQFGASWRHPVCVLRFVGMAVQLAVHKAWV